MSEMFDATKACAVCGYPAPDHSALCSAWRPGVVEMCPCGDMTDRECREANRKAVEASGSVCCARFRDSAAALPPSHPRAGEEVNVDAVESLNEAHPDYCLTQRLIEAVERGTRTDEIMTQAAILSEFTTLRARLVAAEGERDEAVRQLGVALGRLKALHDERQAIFLALNPECPAYPGIPNTCNESVCDCFAADDLAGQVTRLRAAVHPVLGERKT